MIRESHSGGAEGETHLVFSSRTPDGADSIFGEMTGQDAHDHWALPRRVKEILECRRALHLGSPPFECLVRKEKHLLLYLLLAAAPRSQRFLELGSSIFEVIDGLNLAGKILPPLSPTIPRVPLDHVQYFGLEISDFFNETARALHPQHTIRTAPRLSELDGEFDLLFDRAVSSFLFERVSELADLLERCEVAYLNLFLSKSETFTAEWAGKQVTYFSLRELVDELRERGRTLFHLFGDRAPGPRLTEREDVIEGFFLMASPEDAGRFMALTDSAMEIRAWCESKSLGLRRAEELLEPVA